MCPPELLVPGPFSLHANYKNNPHYPTFNDYDLMNPKPKFFKSIQPLKSLDNPYLPKFLFEGEKDQLQAIDNKFAIVSSKNTANLECTFTGMTQRLLGNEMRINTNSLCLFPEVIKQPTKSLKLVPSPRKQLLVTANKIKQQDEQEANKIFSWNWEGLGCFGITCAKPFAGDTSVSLLFKSKINKDKNTPFEANLLKIDDFIKDLKSLTGNWL